MMAPLSQDHLQSMEQRLSELTERCAEILNRWSETDRRHAHAINEVEERLHEWSAIESRLQQDAGQRLRELERSIEHEWQSLRRIHEEPARQLREQAAALGETCLAAANLALRGFERAEARFASLETDLQAQLQQISKDVRALAVTHADAARPAALNPPPAPFPLEGVMRIHDELRQSETAAATPAPSLPDVSIPPTPPRDDGVSRLLPEAAALTSRMDTLERAVSSGQDDARESQSRWERLQRGERRGFAIVAGVIALAVVLGFIWQMSVNRRLDDAAARVAAAERQTAAVTSDAAKQIAASRTEAQRQIAEAQQSALQAGMVSNVLASPDLRRFNLTGVGPAERAYAQVLWSRARGIVLSGARLPAPPAGTVYQLWLVNTDTAVSAGTFAPDAAGRVTFTNENPPSVPSPIAGALVTLEPAGGATAPSGATVLQRAQQ
jgi:hypothetical protein